MTTNLSGPELDERLRRTLRAVAATVGDQSTFAPGRRRRGRRILVGFGAVAIAGALAAGAFYGVGNEYVDKMPPDNVIVAGSIDGDRYWMVESLHTDSCGEPMPGVEIVSEESNIIGQEWNTMGVNYGEPRRLGGGQCGFELSEALADPALSYSGGMFVGDAFVWVVAVHPDITAVRLTIDGAAKEVAVHRLNGAGYCVMALPEGTVGFTVALLIDGQLVPGSKETRSVPRR